MNPVPLPHDSVNSHLEILTDLRVLAPLNTKSGLWNVGCQSGRVRVHVCMHVFLLSA
jgi:hypothetical protein